MLLFRQLYFVLMIAFQVARMPALFQCENVGKAQQRPGKKKPQMGYFKTKRRLIKLKTSKRRKEKETVTHAFMSMWLALYSHSIPA